MPTLKYASAETPKVSDLWMRMSSGERQDRIKDSLLKWAPDVLTKLEVVETLDDGQVILRLFAPISPSERGGLLLDVEGILKKTIDAALVVWLESLGDKSSLRNLRGIEVK